MGQVGEAFPSEPADPRRAARPSVERDAPRRRGDRQQDAGRADEGRALDGEESERRPGAGDGGVRGANKMLAGLTKGAPWMEKNPSAGLARATAAYLSRKPAEALVMLGPKP